MQGPNETDELQEEALEAAADFYDRHTSALEERKKHGIQIRFWTKKLDDIHIEVVPRSPNEPAGLCGRPLLGNDYFMGNQYKSIDKSVGRNRKVCPECAFELQKRLEKEHRRQQDDTQT
ncbi:MAG: hypothetical protein DRP09_10510 [Candidatus Thorarchaeota archaeon]|nr:MAG: hypothetical protein DRP09_10510 [Candidatus Thorarchaeota archaeon]